MLLLPFLGSCTDDETPLSEEASFTFSESMEEGVTIDAEGGATSVITFNSTLEWKAAVSDSWLEISPESGIGGDAELTLTVISPNNTGAVRTATLTLTSGSLSQQISVSQEEYIRVEQETYEIPVEGGDLDIYFYTTIAADEFNAYSSGDSWITSRATSRSVTEESGYYLPLTISPNENNQSRTTTFYFVKEPFDNANADMYILATATVTQAGLLSGESTDYSADKEVRVIQTHTQGNGVPIVLMGDGFIDQEIANGYYDEVMDKAVENLFTEEPMTSLRDYFDIYAVTAVSANNSFGDGYSTAFSCRMEGGTSTLIEGDDLAVQNYVLAVDGINLYETQAIVILNSSAYAGTTTFGYATTAGAFVEFSVAYCPVIYNLESEDFRRVLVHEAVGHGITKLLDEYSYTEMGTIPDSEVATYRSLQDIGWAQNVDFTNDADTVLWSAFLSDSRYEDQGLGVFEGACTYIYGAYRPSEESMMRNNIMGFNAPSRQALYNRVMKSGEEYTPDYEEFVSFDQQIYTVSTRAAETSSRPFAAPRFVNKTLNYKK